MCACRLAAAAGRAAEMPGCETGRSRDPARRTARLLPATLGGRVGILAQLGQTGATGDRQTQDRTTRVILRELEDYVSEGRFGEGASDG